MRRLIVPLVRGVPELPEWAGGYDDMRLRVAKDRKAIPAGHCEVRVRGQPPNASDRLERLIAALEASDDPRIREVADRTRRTTERTDARRDPRE